MSVSSSHAQVVRLISGCVIIKNYIGRYRTSFFGHHFEFLLRHLITSNNARVSSWFFIQNVVFNNDIKFGSIYNIIKSPTYELINALCFVAKLKQFCQWQNLQRTSPLSSRQIDIVLYTQVGKVTSSSNTQALKQIVQKTVLT